MHRLDVAAGTYNTTTKYKICPVDELKNQHLWQNALEQLRKHILHPKLCPYPLSDKV